MTTAEGPHPLRVLQSTPRPGPRTNPYVTQLHDSLRAAGVQVLPFSWRSALLGRYDVAHVHWPEILVYADSGPRAAVRQLLTLLLALRLHLTGTPLVRTVHNVRPHDAVRRRLARAVLRRLEQRESWWVRLNEHTPVRDEARTTTAPHGDYLAWAVAHPPGAPAPGRVVAPGIVRAYKGLDTLVEAMGHLADADVSLHVVGRPDDGDLADRLRAAAAADPRVLLTLRHVDDDELAAAVGEAQLVVLPYRQMHNSGVLLLSLSLGRPVLVPATPVTEALADRVGRLWVLTADLDGPEQLAAALVQGLARTLSGPTGSPDLSEHRWDRVAELHVAAYRSALLAAGRGSR